MAVADTALLDEMAKHPLREMMRNTGLSQHTIEAIRTRRAVRQRTLTILGRALTIHLNAGLGQDYEPPLTLE